MKTELVGSGKAKEKSATKRPTKKKPKDKPKRPLSAYNYFFKEEREKILKVVLAENPEEVKNEPDSDDYLNEETIKRLKKEGGKVSFEEMGKIIGQRWKNIDPDRLATFSELASEDTERYKNEMQTYNGRQEAKMRSEALKPPVQYQTAPQSAAGGMASAHHPHQHQVGPDPGYPPQGMVDPRMMGGGEYAHQMAAYGNPGAPEMGGGYNPYGQMDQYGGYGGYYGGGGYGGMPPPQDGMGMRGGGMEPPPGSYGGGGWGYQPMGYAAGPPPDAYGQGGGQPPPPEQYPPHMYGQGGGAYGGGQGWGGQ